MNVLTKVKPHSLSLLGIVIAIFVLFVGLWQGDINFGGAGTLGPHWNEDFAWFGWGAWYAGITSKGVAFEIQYGLILTAFIVMFLALWFWED